jgi:hypothetical protein
MKDLGEYTKSLITDIPAAIDSDLVTYFDKTIQRFPDEAVYIYSFKQNRMIYADGWENVLGYRDDEINMLMLVSITSPEYIAFSLELNDKALMFIRSKNSNLEEYSFTIELKKIHKNGSPIPLIVKVGVFKSENGRMTEIIGRYQINHSIRFGKVMRYAAYGPETLEFEEELNKQLFQHYAISTKKRKHYR